MEFLIFVGIISFFIYLGVRRGDRHRKNCAENRHHFEWSERDGATIAGSSAFVQEGICTHCKYRVGQTIREVEYVDTKTSKESE